VNEFKEYTAAELSGRNNVNVQAEISRGLLTNYGGEITEDQKKELLKVWAVTIGKPDNNYQINDYHLKHFYTLKASYFGTLSNQEINAALEQAGVSPEEAASANYTASPEALNAANGVTTAPINLFTKYKTPLLVLGLALLAAGGFYYFKKR
jgi:hypothetical protein